MYFFIRQFPELRSLSKEEIRAVLRRVPWTLYPRLIFRSVIVGLLGAGIVIGVARAAVGPDGRAGAEVVATVVGLFLVLRHYTKQMAKIRGEMQLQILAAFHGQRIPFCMHCGYDLRGAPASSDVCSECGGPTGPAVMRYDA